MVTQSTSMLFPILFLVILKIVDIARDVSSEGDLGSNWELSETSTSFGPFLLIHSVNYITLTFMFVGISSLYGQNLIIDLITLHDLSIYFYLTVFTLSFWLLLPVFEVKEYYKASPTGVIPLPTSFKVHLSLTLLIAGLVQILGPHRAARPDTSNPIRFIVKIFYIIGSDPIFAITDFLLGIISMIIFPAAIFGFVSELKEEMK